MSNSSFVDQISHDGMRKHLVKDFESLYVLDLGGNVRKFPQFPGTTHNVFGIQVGVSIELFIRKRSGINKPGLFYSDTPPEWRRARRLQLLESSGAISGLSWTSLVPTSKGSWIASGHETEYAKLNALGSKEAKAGANDPTIFSSYSLGSNTNRDTWAYNFSKDLLSTNIRSFLTTYSSECERWHSTAGKKHIDQFLTTDETRIKWSSTLKQILIAATKLEFSSANLRESLYRPFSFEWQYFAKGITHRRGQWHQFIPNSDSDNIAFCATGVGAERPFAVMATRKIPDLNFFGPGTVPMWYPFFTYDENTKERRENVTGWSLSAFRNHYSDASINKWEIFHCTYAILHHPEYRTRYAANLKRELPRIPFPPDFHAFARAGKRLMELHIDYEKQTEYPLQQIEDEKAEVSFRVTRMSINRKDRSELRYNDFLTLRGIPLEAYDYKLGNRSALEWVVDQYRVSTDARSGIVNDPNRDDDPQYILRLIGQVITVSLETQKIIGELPSLNLGS